MPSKVKPPVNRPALVRRARWLEKRLQETDRTGRSYDEKEYLELLADFKLLGVEYKAAPYPEVKPQPATPQLEEPPIRPDTSTTWSPGAKPLSFRTAGRFLPGGML